MSLKVTAEYSVTALTPWVVVTVGAAFAVVVTAKSDTLLPTVLLVNVSCPLLFTPALNPAKAPVNVPLAGSVGVLALACKPANAAATSSAVLSCVAV